MSSIDYLHRAPHDDLVSVAEPERASTVLGNAIRRALALLGVAALVAAVVAIRFWAYAPLSLHAGN